MTFQYFKTWLEGFGEAAGLTVDQIKCICDKVIIISGIEEEVRKESMQNFKVSLDTPRYLQCFHPPDGACLNCASIDAHYSNGAASVFNPILKCPHGSGCNMCNHN